MGNRPQEIGTRKDHVGGSYGGQSVRDRLGMGSEWDSEWAWVEGQQHGH